MIHFGNKLKKLIESSGKTNRVVAKKLGMTENALYKIFNKEHVSTEIISKICNCLNVDFLSFLNDSIDQAGSNNSTTRDGHMINQINSGDARIEVNSDKELIKHLREIISLKDEIIDGLKKRLKDK